jgi:hypothetical protein
MNEITFLLCGIRGGNVLDIATAHLLLLLLSITALIVLFLVLKETRSEFVIKMVVSFMLLMTSTMIFSGIFFVDSLDGHIHNPMTYNWMSTVVRIQNVVTVIWIGFLALRRKKK